VAARSGILKGGLPSSNGTRSWQQFDRLRPVPYTGEKTMYILLWIIHVVVCLFLIIVVLLQSGKAADLAGAFGGMGSQTAFGPRGSATLLSKATTLSAILFMLTSLSLSILATKNAGLGTSVLESTPKTGAPARSAPLPVPAQPKGNTAPLPMPTNSTPQQGAPAPAAPAKK